MSCSMKLPLAVSGAALFIAGTLAPVDCKVAESSKKDLAATTIVSDSVSSRGRCSSGACASDHMLLQKPGGMHWSKAEVTLDKMDVPTFCKHKDSSVWMHFCNHWETAVSSGAIPGGKDICCDSLPAPCRHISGASVACSVEPGCLVPSCAQEEWYLGTVESYAADAFIAFGRTTEDFRRCAFRTEQTHCNKVDADFSESEASNSVLEALIAMNKEDLEATAWEVVTEFGPNSPRKDTDAPSKDDRDGERALLQERSMAKRRNSEFARALDSAVVGKQAV